MLEQMSTHLTTKTFRDEQEDDVKVMMRPMQMFSACGGDRRWAGFALTFVRQGTQTRQFPLKLRKRMRDSVMAAQVITIAALLGSLAIPVWAADTESKDKPRENECLFSTTVRDWRPLDREHLVIWGPSRKDAYLVTLMGGLTDLQFSENVAFIDGDHDGMICGRGGDQVSVPGSVVGMPTFIKSMKRLDEAGLEAVGQQYKVKLTRKKKAEPEAAGQ